MKFKVKISSLLLASSLIGFSSGNNIFAAACPAASGSTITVSVSVTSGCNIPAADSLNISTAGNISGVGPASMGSVEVSASSSSVTNAGTIYDSSPSNSANGLYIGPSGSLLNLDNSGLISSTATGQGAIYNQLGNIGGVSSGGITNSGTIIGLSQDAIVNLFGTIYSIVNLSGGTIGAVNSAINNYGSIDLIQNSGLIHSTSGAAISNGGSGFAGSISTIINNPLGVISGATYAIVNNSPSTIGTITNWGTIIGGINNGNGFSGPVIGTLNNAQNGLVYAGTLPTYYNTIITASSYGSLVASPSVGVIGTTTFGISPLSTLRAGVFQNVLQGIGGVNLTNTGASTGIIASASPVGGYNWTLTYDGANWDLTLALAGPSAANTQTSLQNAANSLKGVYALQTSAITNGLTYDCNVFDKEGICVSAGGRYDRVNTGDTHASNGLLIGSYKVDANTRVGAWVDQNLSASSATGVNLNNGQPMFGVFGVWNADKSGNGFEARLSAGYGDKDLTTTRQVVGSSEAGTGKTRLNTQGVSAVVSYNVPVATDLTVSPYLGARYTRVNANSYTEATSSAVTTPLTLSALKQETTTALAGLKVSARMSPECGVFGSIGAELDTNNQGNNYSATGVTDLTAIAFNADAKRLRGVASVGTYYDLDKTQRISLNAVYREEAFQKVNTLSTMATYTAGF